MTAARLLEAPVVVRVLALAFALASLDACSGGGGGSPNVTFSFATSAASTSEGAAPLAIQVVLHTSLASLTAPASVDVVDLGTGTATSGSDYAALGPTTLTFPIGSVDGAMQSVMLSAAADLLFEGRPETVRLGLRNATGAGIQGPSSFTASLDDAEVATVQFATPAAATPDESSATRNVTLRLGLTPGATLGVAVSAVVSDAHTGTATSGADYATFAPHTVTFPIGSADGTTQTVGVQVIDDASIELGETVDLVIGTPSAGTLVGPTNAFQLTITDDDALSGSALVASEGPTGVENVLAYDEIVDLGSRAVATGPNAGTRVRVTNAGGTSMSLGAPRLTGANPDDFDVEVEVAPLAPPPPGDADAPPAADVAAPLAAIAGAPGPGIAFGTDPAALRALSALPRASMHGFPLPGFGDSTLELQRLPLPVAEDAVLRVDGVAVEGGLRAALSDLTVWRGSVREIPGSRVFLALGSSGARGFVELPFPADRLVHIVTERPGSISAPAACRIVRDRDLEALGFEQTPDFCSEPRIPPGRSAALLPSSTGPENLTLANCRIAIETDYQLYQKLGSVQAVTNYVTELMAAVSDRYFTDVQTSLSIAYLGVYSSASDPWHSQDSGGNAGNLLDEFVTAWAPNHWPVQANLAHFISGANLGGGIAYVDVLCDSSFGFGVSGNISGTIDWGAWTGQPGNFTWDFVVVAHEIGHNFGALHTHSYCPPLDLCYTNCTNTTVCSLGTLMSYCHVCGGMGNIDLRFHQVSANVMRQTVNSSCLGLSALAGGDYVQYLVRFGPLATTGARSASLEFSHDASNEPQPFRIQLHGTATP